MKASRLHLQSMPFGGDAQPKKSPSKSQMTSSCISEKKKQVSVLNGANGGGVGCVGCGVHRLDEPRKSGEEDSVSHPLFSTLL